MREEPDGEGTNTAPYFLCMKSSCLDTALLVPRGAASPRPLEPRIERTTPARYALGFFMAAMFVAKNWRSADAWSSAGSEASVEYAFASSADGENCMHEHHARTAKDAQLLQEEQELETLEHCSICRRPAQCTG